VADDPNPTNITYTPTTWRDSSSGGTPLTAARLNNAESGIAAVVEFVSDLVDRINAVEVALATGGSTGGGSTGNTVTLPSGTTAQRPTPSDGQYFYDTTLNRPIWGDGSAWRDADGTALSGTGGSGGPANFTAVVQSDNSIAMSWSAVPGATSYKLYETESPSGVNGATALVTTTTTRSPSTLRNYEYWVTATVSGVETATSNRVVVSLPFGSTPTPGGGSTGGGSTGGTPAAILNIGSGASQAHFNVGIGYSTGHVDKTMAQIVNGFVDSPYFVANAAGTAVQFQVFMNGKTTSTNTHYTRSELRELLANGTTKAAWTAGSGTHTMEYTFKLIHLQPNKPWVTIGQIHDASSDALSIKIKGDTTSSLQVIAVFDDADQSPALASSYTLGTSMKIKIELINGTLKLYANGVLKITSNAISGATGCYFKLGVYPQSKDNWGGFESPSEYCMAEISGLTVTHSSTS
jgi:hypothetical protein